METSGQYMVASVDKENNCLCQIFPQQICPVISINDKENSSHTEAFPFATGDDDNTKRRKALEILESVQIDSGWSNYSYKQVFDGSVKIIAETERDL